MILPEDIVLTARQLSKEVREAGENLLWVDECLTGLCAFAAYELTRRLKKLGYPVQFVVGEYSRNYHCWTVWGDCIIDLTAKQFSDRLPFIYVTNEDRKYFPFHTGNAAAHEVSSVWFGNGNDGCHDWKRAFYGGVCRL